MIKKFTSIVMFVGVTMNTEVSKQFFHNTKYCSVIHVYRAVLESRRKQKINSVEAKLILRGNCFDLLLCYVTIIGLRNKF